MITRNHLLCLLAGLLVGLPWSAIHAQPFQKVFKYWGVEDYMHESRLHTGWQAQVSLGYVTDSNNIHTLLLSDLQGNIVWNRAIVDDSNSYFGLDRLALEGNGIFVGGEADGDSIACHVTRFDSAGNIDWVRQFSYYPDHVGMMGLAGDGLGNLVISGTIHDQIFSNSGMVGKIRASDGMPLWMSTIDDSVEFEIRHVAANAQGDVFASGNVTNWPFSTANWAWLAKWSPTGTLQWCRQLDRDFWVEGIATQGNWVHVMGYDLTMGHTGLMRVSQAGVLDQYNLLGAVGMSESYPLYIHSDAQGIVLSSYVNFSGTETSALMRFDTSLSLVYAWEDGYASIEGIAGVDAGGMLHFVGSYFQDPLNDEVFVLGAVPDAPISSIPCGMNVFAPYLYSATANLSNYAVATGSTQRWGYVNSQAYSLGLSQLTACGTASDVDDGTTAVPYCWPNPTDGKLHLQIPEGMFAEEGGLLRLVALDGREILNHPVQTGETELELTTLPAGIYLLRLGAQWQQRITVVH